MRHGNPWVVYADVFSLALMSFLMMICVLILIPLSKQTADKDFHPKAEYMIVLDWDDTKNVDLDLWVKNPQGELIWYRNREVSNIGLDRDARGYISNRTQMPDGTVVDSSNEEITTIRAILPGDYEVGVSYYSGSQKEGVDYTVKLIKVNPKVIEVKKLTGHLERVKDVDKALSFHIEQDGAVTVIPNSDEPFLPIGSIP